MTQNKRKPPKPMNRRKIRNLLTAADWAVFEPDNAADLQVARVYVNFGIESGVNLGGELIRLRNQRNLPVVAGDYVYTDGKAVLGIKPRGKVLARYADEGGVRMIASHLDRVAVVCSASLPPNHEGFIDRYLVYCRIVELPLFIILNKIDELDEEEAAKVMAFEEAGVEVIPVSAVRRKGLKKLGQMLASGTTVLTGLSGVGKSTLINALFKDEELIPTQEISQATGRGRHTTTAAEAYDYEQGLIIDTPGIKKFGFIGVSADQVIKGFPEFAPFAEKCRFPDCRHLDDEGCAVREAAEKERIDGRRYDAYAEMRLTIEDVEDPR